MAPEPDEREGVAVERGPGDDRDDVVGGAHRKRGQEEADEPMTVAPRKDAVRYAAFDGAGRGIPDRVPEEVDEKDEYPPSERIPDRDIDDILSSVSYGHEEVHGGEKERRQDPRGPRARSTPHTPSPGSSRGKG